MARVLLVEDDENQLAIRKLLFEHHGHEVICARTGAEALELLDPPPALAVVDLSLPALPDGLALLPSLNAATPRTPVRRQPASGGRAGRRTSPSSLRQEGA